MDRPKEAIERIREWKMLDANSAVDLRALFAYLDWLEGKHVVEWPVELTRERLEDLSSLDNIRDSAKALYALAAIAPQRKKRVVNIWETGVGNLLAIPVEQTPNMNHWRKVAGPIEI